MSPSQSVSWYAVRVRTKSEVLVSSFFEQRGLESFAPTYELRRKYSDRMKRVEAALFPGYVFCRFNACASLPVLSTPSVQNIVGFGDGPHPVSDTEIERLRHAVAAGTQLTPTSWLSSGCRVRVRCGPLAGIEGYLINVKNHQHRLVICADLLQKAAAVEVNIDEVEAAG
ncbi:transcription termination/antitermination protein NusG [Nevskia soli]|jgi:transcription antitermination factor NusG|uniref:transcription termination/antitermination protein NusG n=1 Tax=Nevskia soli TaxID=418856 RepID=UPI0015D787AF|nr:transcription termination/antitermination NusG family protein [Nevskia soli]